MDLREIQALLNCPYNRANWLSILQSVFREVQIFNTNNIIEVNNPKVASFKLLGSVTLNDGKKLALLELKLHENVNIVRNRVELNNLVSKYIDFNTNYGVLSIFEQGGDDYRLSFSTKSVVYDEQKNDFVTKGTETKRFTYLLGRNESCKTPAERLFNLSTKKNETNIEKVEEAFSVEILSKSFFKEYQTHFNLFVDFIKGNDIFNHVFNADETAARNFVKVLFGRIVFIKFLQKKGWMGVPAHSNDWKDGNRRFLEDAFSNSSNKAHFHSKFLVPLFFDGLNRQRENDFFPLTGDKVPYLGGGLFFDEYPETHRIDFPETYFKDFFEFLEKYNFTIDENDPTEQEIGVDPEMLGHIFENLLEDNKDKGAFYTPKEIVHYMCRESLKEYLKTYLSEKNLWNEAEEQLDQSLSGLLNGKSVDEQLTPFCKELASALKNVKICDPAIGSGAFPMGLLNEIFHTAYTLYLKDNSIAQVWEMDGWQPAKVKLNIIQNSIYGVDIEKGAVDIARLRFWLSLVVDEEVPQALPNLDYKIVAGNSLVSKLGDRIIDIDWNIRKKVGSSTEHVDSLKRNLSELVIKQREFFENSNENLKLEIRNLKINILLSQLRLDKTIYANANVIKQDMGLGLKDKEIKKNEEIGSALSTYDQNIAELETLLVHPELPLQFFDWKLDFPEVLNEQLVEKPGFDIVIGNPPYVVPKNLKEEDLKFYKEKFTSALYQINLYLLFIEKAIILSKKKAITTLIVPNTWLINKSVSPFRKSLIENNNIQLIADLTKEDVFNATVLPIIFNIKKEKINNYKIKVLAFDGFNFKPSLLIKVNDILEDKNFNINYQMSSDNFIVISKIEENSVPLSSLADCSFGVKFYQVNKGKPKQTKEIVANHSYTHNNKINQHCKMILEGKDIESYKHKFSNKWIEYGEWLAEPRSPSLFQGERILLRRIVGKGYLISQFIEGDYCNNSLLHTVKIKNKKYDTKYVLSILNSKLIGWYFIQKYARDEKTFPEIRIHELSSLPIKFTKNQEEFTVSVNQVLIQKSQNINTTSLEQQIDNLVYRLYELNYDEVKIIEPEIEQRLSREEYEAIIIE